MVESVSIDNDYVLSVARSIVMFERAYSLCS
jgi:hypothetical protein